MAIKTATEVIARGDSRIIIDFAIELNRQILSEMAQLEALKEHLRKTALGGRSFWDGRQRIVEMEGNLGVSSVVFPPNQVKVKKGCDLRDLETNLPSDTFTTLFQKRVVIEPVTDFESRVGSLSPAETTVVNRFVEVKPQTPKVYLPR
jgi:hypothetical protein